MNRCLRNFLISLLILTASSQLSAQLFPVDAFLTTQMSFPANVNALGTSFGGINLTLVLRDNDAGSTQVRLRFQLEKNGVNLITSNEVVLAPIALISNVPLVLTGTDLESYFLPQHFQIIEGMTRESFLRSGGDLPEGLYTICVEVLDFLRFTEAPLSAKVCSLADMDLLDPPLITTPYEDQIIEVPDTFMQQPVDINWLMNYSTLVFPVDYHLYIYEYNETARAFGLGNDFFNRQPLFETFIPSSTLTLNNFIFGIHGEVETMQVGHQYVIRVQAMSSQMAGQHVYFRNQGFSDPVLFQYGRRNDPLASDCSAPVIINAAALSDGEYSISWTEIAGATGYDIVVTYQDGAPVDSIYTAATSFTFSGLDIEQKYKGTIWVTCGNGDRLPSAPFFITTNRELPTIVYHCGLPTEPLLNQNTTPVPSLQEGDTIMAGDFKVKLSNVSGGDGSFSGTGVMVWNFPFRNVLNAGQEPIAVHMAFEDIKVNTDHLMYAGHMQVSGAGLALANPDLADFMREFGELDFIADEFKQGPELLQLDFRLDDIQVAMGSITITGTDSQGNPVILEIPWDGEDIEIFDSEGTAWVVDEEGDVTEAGSLAEGGRPTSSNTQGVDANGEPTILSAAGVVFSAGAGLYAFDAVDPDVSEAERVLYPATPIASSDEMYYSPYKAIRKGSNDVLTARIIGTNINPDSLVFKTQSGRKIDHSGEGNELTIEVKGLFSSATETILACLKTGDRQELVGTFRLMHVPFQQVNVVLVPLGDASLPTGIDQTISEIFAPVAIALDITTHAALPFPADLPGPDGTIDTEGSGTFANYSQEQQAINEYIRNQLGSAYNTQTYYLLFTDAPSSSNLAGYMPLSRQFGYLFNGGDEEGKGDLAITAAHELGHGIYGLEHPFSRLGVPLGSTDWLMDYSQGTSLPYIHWAQMYDPEFRLYLFQGDQEGEQIVSNEAFIYSNYIYFAYTEDPQPQYGGITPSGQRFILPNDAVASFYPSDDGLWPQGCLAGFRLGTTPYFGWWSKSKKSFSGYAPGYVNEAGTLIRDGPYLSSLNVANVPVFLGRSSADCVQEVWWQEQGNDLPIFSDPGTIQAVAQDAFIQYETAQVPPSPCGCFSGECSELLQTYRSHPYLQSDNILKRVICSNPCVLQDFAHHSFFLQPTSEWMENLNNICGSLLAFGFAPAVIAGVGISLEGILPPILQSIAAQSAQQLSLRFSLGSITDMLIQRAVYYYFADEGQEVTWEETQSMVDITSAVASGFESILILNSKMEEAAVSAAISCFVDGNLSQGTLHEGFDVQQCAKGALSAIAFHGILGMSSSALGHLKDLSPPNIVTGFRRLVAEVPTGAYTAGPSSDGVIVGKMLSHVFPEPLEPPHIKALFGIDDDQAAAFIADAFASDPTLATDLLESGFFLKILNLSVPSNVKANLVEDLAGNKGFRDAVVTDEGLVRAWEVLSGVADPGIKSLRLDALSLLKFEDIIRSNNLGLDENGLQNVLGAAAIKGQQWDFPENILDAVKRASDANISGMTVTHKKFPQPSDGNSSFVLEQAKKYQEGPGYDNVGNIVNGSGDANLSFEVGGRSFDDIAPDGKLVDRKYGYGNSIFDRVQNEFGEVDLFVHNPIRIKGLLTQAKGQLDAASGHPIRWEISSATGADGIQSIFNGNFPQFLDDFPGVDFNTIEVVYIPLQ